MKKLVIAILAVGTLSATAQDSGNARTGDMETLVNSGGFGGMLSITTKASSLNKQECLLVGAEVAMIFGHSLNIGFAGYGLTTRVQSNNQDIDGHNLFYDMGYGGFFIEPVILSKKLVHVTFPVVLGAGGVGESYSRMYDYNENMNYNDNWNPYYSDAFLVAEPGISAELNIARWMRLSAGASYRFVSQLDLPNTPSNAFSGVAGNVSIRFGWF